MVTRIPRTRPAPKCTSTIHKTTGNMQPSSGEDPPKTNARPLLKPTVCRPCTIKATLRHRLAILASQCTLPVAKPGLSTGCVRGRRYRFILCLKGGHLPTGLSAMLGSPHRRTFCELAADTQSVTLPPLASVLGEAPFLFFARLPVPLGRAACGVAGESLLASTGPTETESGRENAQLLNMVV